MGAFGGGAVTFYMRRSLRLFAGGLALATLAGVGPGWVCAVTLDGDVQCDHGWPR